MKKIFDDIARCIIGSGIKFDLNTKTGEFVIFDGDDEFIFVKKQIKQTLEITDLFDIAATNNDKINDNGRFKIDGQKVKMASTRMINGQKTKICATGETKYYGKYKNGGRNSMRLLAGSSVVVKHVAGVGQDIIDLKNKLLDARILVASPDPHFYILLDTIEFKSISSATTFVRGQRSSGYEHWECAD